MMEKKSDDNMNDKSKFSAATFKDDYGFTDLHIAAWTGNLRKLSALLQKNADVNIQDNEMRTPLHLAAVQGHQEIVEALVEANANMNVKDKGENTPLLKALEVGNKVVAKYLIEKGADLDITDSDKNTALHIAIQKGHRKLTLEILRRIEDVNRTNKGKETPLHLASRRGMTDCVKQLLQNNAYINCCDSKSRTPLMLAASRGHSDIVEMLLQAGAEVDFLSSNGLTAKEIAEEEGYYDIANNIGRYFSNKKKELLSADKGEAYYSLGIKEIPEQLLTARSEKKKVVKETRYDYGDIGGGGIHDRTVSKVSAIMDDMKGTTNKLSLLHAELKQRQKAENNNRKQIQRLREELDKALLQRSELVNSSRSARASIKSVKDELNEVHDNVHKLQMENDKLQQKLIDEEAANSDLKRHLDRAKAQEQDIMLAMDRLQKHIDEMKADRQALETENAKMDDMINQLKAEHQDKERQRGDWSEQMAAANSEKSNLLLQVEILEKDKSSKQKALDDYIRNYETKVQTIIGEREALEKKLNGEVWRRNIADKKILALQQEVTNVADEYSAAKKEAKDLQAKLEEQCQSHANAEKILREQVEILKADNISLSERVNDLKTSLQQLESELEKEHIESDTMICRLHKKLNKINNLLREKSRDKGDI